jgi:hypothetical protein
MTTMPGRHPSFFMTDLVISLMKITGFPSAHVAISYFMINSTVLIIQTMIYFGPARMGFCKIAILCHGNICYSKEYYKKRGE